MALRRSAVGPGGIVAGRGGGTSAGDDRAASTAAGAVSVRWSGTTGVWGTYVSARAETSIGTVQRVDAQALAQLGALLADRSRAELLMALMDGRAHTGSELARHVGIAPSTASEHLSRLLDGGLVAVEAQGRHRYVRLAGPPVAAMLEALGTAGAGSPPTPRPPAGLAYARTCYDHLAGELAVTIHDDMFERGLLAVDDGQVAVTGGGVAFLAGLGADVGPGPRPPRARQCLDWTERRHHLAGPAGRALLAAVVANGWVVPGARPRAMRVTGRGRAEMARHFPRLNTLR
jgi:DNA-binding transcriptional ArsR family regulator